VKRARIFDTQGLEALAAKLKEVRESKDETQESLSAKSGITLSTIARIETARINPSVSTVFALARAMKISPKELFDFKLK
jgi:transcriptional regulator with XRE-family HTH domain